MALHHRPLSRTLSQLSQPVIYPLPRSSLRSMRDEWASRIGRERRRRGRNYCVHRRRMREVEHVLERIRVGVAQRQMLDVRVAIAVVVAEEALFDERNHRSVIANRV